MADNTIAYYEDGVPHSADGKVVIVIDGKMPVDTGAGGTDGGGGGKVGGTSESSAAIHATAKWSTAQLKKTLAEKAARERETAAAMAAAKAKRDALTQHLKDIVNDVLRHNASRTPSATDLAHANNMAMQAEAQRLGRAKAEKQARKEAEAAELAFQEAERQREEAARQLAETERQLKQAEEEKRLAALSDEARAVENARKNLDTAKSELANVDSDIERQRSQLSSLDADVKKAEENLGLTMRIKGRIGRKMQAKSQAIVDDKKRIYSDAENVLNTMTANRNLKAQQVTDAENALKVATDNLVSSQIKSAVDATISFYQRLTLKYGEKYSLIAQELAEKSKGKKIGNVDEALAAFEKYKDVLYKKFSKVDRDAIVNASKSVDYADWAKHLDQFSRYLKISGRVSTGYDIYSDIRKGMDTNDWRPLFLTLEKLAVDAGVGYIVALGFSVIASTALGIWGVAIITGIICSFVDKKDLEKLNEALGI
ncbi:colicin-10 [Salmonella enterica]|nr:colicin-10 [Salmonella enterica subsp. enterica serovar Sandiego]EEK2578059.1 colicin-10 [Salmonella enterica subsp. enterica serovar Montevideo]EEP1514362.1 colicin-10 [Salmonella enterica]